MAAPTTHTLPGEAARIVAGTKGQRHPPEQFLALCKLINMGGGIRAAYQPKILDSRCSLGCPELSLHPIT